MKKCFFIWYTGAQISDIMFILIFSEILLMTVKMPHAWKASDFDREEAKFFVFSLRVFIYIFKGPYKKVRN